MSPAVKLPDAGSIRRGLTLFACECCRPTAGVFPQIAHFLAMIQVYPDGLRSDQTRDILRRAGTLVFFEHAAQQIEVCPGIGPVGHPDLKRSLPDSPQDYRRIALERRSSVPARLGDHRLERGREALGRRRRRPMIVNDATSRRFERAG